MRLFRGLFAMLLGAGLLLSVGMVPKPVLADDVAVTECTPDGLATAITAAGAGGMVTFDCDPATIDFAADEQITITQDVTIDGSNGDGDQIVLDGNEQSRFFTVQSGTLKLQGITLQNGNAGSARGGAILIEASGAVEVNRGTFTDNSALYGGAIYNLGSLTINQSTFESNSARLGAAVCNGNAVSSSPANLTVADTRFERNSAGESGGEGGAINNQSNGKATIVRASFVDNAAAADGGAIMNWGEFSLVASTISGSSAGKGSAFSNEDKATTTLLAWSTIIQPASTSPALFLGSPVTIIGVILGGEGAHCDFGTGGELTDSYSLADDTSCGLDGAGSAEVGPFDGLNNLGLGPLATISINDVEQSFYLPLSSPAHDGGLMGCDTDIQAASPDLDQLGGLRPVQSACDIGAIELGRPPIMTSVIPTPTLVATNQPVSVQVTATDDVDDTLFFIIYCDVGDSVTTSSVTSSSGTFTASGTCSYGQPGTYTIQAQAFDDQTAPSGMVVSPIAVQVVIPTTLCADQWSGSLRLGEDCGRGETLIELPTDDPISLCVNDWNGSTSLGADCSRSEHQVGVRGDDSIAVCINRWNGTLRVSDLCSRSERGDWLEGGAASTLRSNHALPRDPSPKRSG